MPPELQKTSSSYSLELAHKRHNFEVLGYVVMPEHVHLLIGEPPDYELPLSKAIQSLKLSVSKRLAPRPFWQARYYDFNVFNNKRVEKLKYMNRNPVTRGLVEDPRTGPGSSYRHYLLGRTRPSPDIPALRERDGSCFARWPTLRPRRRWGTRLWCCQI